MTLTKRINPTREYTDKAHEPDKRTKEKGRKRKNSNNNKG